jgi:hypothetical protein
MQVKRAKKQLLQCFMWVAPPIDWGFNKWPSLASARPFHRVQPSPLCSNGFTA